MKRASTFSAVIVAALAIGTAGPATAQSGTAAAGQAGSSGAGSTSPIPGGGQSSSDTSVGTPAAPQPKVDERQQFIDKAAIANMAEIQLGQLAASNAQDPQVKQFAQMMVDEHTKALDELRTAAGSATLPSSLDKKHQKLHDKLAKLQGASFDRAYMDAMVDAHKDTEKLLSKHVGHDRAARNDASHGTGAMAGVAGASGSGTAAGATGTSGTGTPSQAGDASGTSSGATTNAGAIATSGSVGGGVDEWAASTLPKVQSHLAQARTIDAQVKQEQRPPAAVPDATMPPRTPDAATPTQPGPPTPPQR